MSGKHRRRVPRRSCTPPAAVVTAVAASGLLFSGTADASSVDPPSLTDVNWDAIAQCESGGNWATNTGNGFYGGLQYTLSTWHAYGGSGNPAAASRDEQIRVARNVLAAQGIGAWPVCGRQAGSTKVVAVKAAPKLTPHEALASPLRAATPVASPPSSTVPPPATVPGPSATVAAGPATVDDYTTVDGDSLQGIAVQLQVPDEAGVPGWQRIAQANPGVAANPDVIPVAAHLLIPQAVPAAVRPAARDVGDVLSQSSAYPVAALAPASTVADEAPALPRPLVAPPVADQSPVVVTATGSPGGEVKPTEVPATKPAAAPKPVSLGGVGAHVVSLAVGEQGVPYVYGGASPGGFDCSGLVQWAFRKVGIELPRTAAAQSTVGRSVSISDLQPGDLLFFYRPVDHVVMYVGNGQIVEASQPGYPVKVRPLYTQGFVGARRII